MRYLLYAHLAVCVCAAVGLISPVWIAVIAAVIVLVRDRPRPPRRLWVE